LPCYHFQLWIFPTAQKPQKVRDAVKYLHRFFPNLTVDGEIQSDFALNKKMLQDTFPFSRLSGKKVNTLIFPNLEAGQYYL
jgi:malate dehydrogenase (oxaloacetate-decarboxylating)(NADP+)